MSAGFKQMANFTNETVFKFVDIVDSVIAVFENVSAIGDDMADAIPMDTLRKGSEIGNKIANATDKVAEYSDTIDLPRQILLYFTVLLPLVLMILVVISRFVCWWMSWGMTFCGFIITFVALCSFGFLYPLSSGIADVCVFLDDSLSDPDHDTFIKSYFQCGPGAPLGKFSEIAEDAINTAANTTCTLLETLESVEVPCDANGDDTVDVTSSSDRCKLVKIFDGSLECNASTFSTLARNAKIYNYTIGCFYSDSIIPTTYEKEGECGTENTPRSVWEDPVMCTARPGDKAQGFYCYVSDPDSILVSLDECVDSCYDNELRNNATNILKYVNAAADVFDIYNEKIKPYINCESLVEILNNTKDFTCITVVNSVTPMYVGELMAGIGSFIGTFVALLSTKRFHKRYRRKYAILKEGGHEVELVA